VWVDLVTCRKMRGYFGHSQFGWIDQEKMKVENSGDINQFYLKEDRFFLEHALSKERV
jgi:hypothetical protein